MVQDQRRGGRPARCPGRVHASRNRRRGRALLGAVPLEVGPGGVLTSLYLVKIHATSRPGDDVSAEPHHWTVETDDYEQGITEVVASVPEGWKLLGVRVER